VDLGASYTLNGTKVTFQYARNYRYKIEVSTDNINWTTVANKTTTTSTTQTRQDSFNATPGRYVRITYTGLPWYPVTWASQYEFEVYGY
jgi:alpha-L-fucosidase